MNTRPKTLAALGSTAGLDFCGMFCEIFPVTSRHGQWAAFIGRVTEEAFDVVFAKYDCSSRHHAKNMVIGAIANMKSNA